jgi:hypothetical protein
MIVSVVDYRNNLEQIDECAARRSARRPNACSASVRLAKTSTAKLESEATSA